MGNANNTCSGGCCNLVSINHSPSSEQQQEVNDDDLLLKGVSVYYLQHILLQEVQDAGLDVESAKVYEMEPDLDSDSNTKFGLLRQKGANVICPRDGHIGAAYVDAIDQCDDFVGRANVMLSYSWGYVVKSIVDTLVAKCLADGRDTKRTYIWICCLCNNQHRIGNDVVTFDQFRKTFYGTVTGVGRLWSLMSPWDNPQYLKRIWCVFEIYVANTEAGVEAEIIMPEEQERKMVESLEDINKLLDVLSKTSIENANASREEDKQNILKLVAETIGYANLNMKINNLYRDWITGILLNVAEQGKTNEFDDKDLNLGHAKTLYGIGGAFLKMGHHDKAVEMYEECLAIRSNYLGKEHVDTAEVYNEIGIVKRKKGDNDGALEMFEQCLTIFVRVLGKEDAQTATAYNNVGLVKKAKGDYDGALVMYQQALAIQEKDLGLDTAVSYNNIATVKKVKGDYDDALKMYKQALLIRETILGEDHVSTALSYNSIGELHRSKGDYSGALEMYHKALVIRKKAFGEDHPSVAVCYNNIGMVKYASGDYNGALEMLEKCVAIRVEALGKDHPKTANTYKGIKMVKKAKRKEEG